MTTSRYLLAFLTLLACSPGGALSHAAKVNRVTVPNTYRMMEDRGSIDLAPKCAGLSKLEIVDEREDTATVGEIFKENNPSLRDSIILEGELTDWVGRVTREILETAAISLNEAGAPILVLEIKQFQVEAKVAFNAEFQGTIVLEAVVRNAGTREVCWESRIKGVGENYGRPRHTENYVEVMSRSADRALFSLLDEAGFLDALCECR